MDYSRTETEKNHEQLKRFKAWSSEVKSRNQIIDRRMNLCIIVISSLSIVGLVIGLAYLFTL